MGFEALARMNSAYFGLVMPEKFIDITERKQLIVSLNNIILMQACTYISKLQTLRKDFTSSVLGAIKETGINGRNLTMEITETVIMNNYNIINEKLKELKTHGIKISIDDFGTGCS
ncbi:MAG TPA: hypothetical protein DDZ89_08115 [Clostridiales bacterium]|nr:hypothetical protein [Clostridiales bacterium]